MRNAKVLFPSKIVGLGGQKSATWCQQKSASVSEKHYSQENIACLVFSLRRWKHRQEPHLLSLLLQGWLDRGRKKICVHHGPPFFPTLRPTDFESVASRRRSGRKRWSTAAGPCASGGVPRRTQGTGSADAEKGGSRSSRQSLEGAMKLWIDCFLSGNIRRSFVN